jgi:hypothetical protein
MLLLSLPVSKAAAAEMEKQAKKIAGVSWYSALLRLFGVALMRTLCSVDFF